MEAMVKCCSLWLVRLWRDEGCCAPPEGAVIAGAAAAAVLAVSRLAGLLSDLAAALAY